MLAADTPLGAPIDVGPVRLRNRFVATAHASGLVRDGLALPGDAEYWGRLADGGAAMLISGGTVTAPESTPRRRNLGEAWRPEVVPGWARRVDAIRSGGGVAVCQLVHLGRETLGAETWYAPVGAGLGRPLPARADGAAAAERRRARAADRRPPHVDRERH